MIKKIRQIVKHFQDKTKDKYSKASQFIILDETDGLSKKKIKDELFEFQHAGTNYCICGHDEKVCHPDNDVCFNHKCDCLQYIPSEYNNKLDVTQQNNQSVKN